MGATTHGYPAIVELQIQLRAERPDHAGNQLIGEGCRTAGVDFRRIMVLGDDASGADAATESDGKVRRQREIEGAVDHHGADGGPAISTRDNCGSIDGRNGIDVLDLLSAAIGGGFDRITGPAILQLNAEPVGGFESRCDIVPRSVPKLDRATRSGALVLYVRQLGPASTQPKIPAIAPSQSRRGEEKERCARKRCGSEFHFKVSPYATAVVRGTDASQYCIAAVMAADAALTVIWAVSSGTETKILTAVRF